MKYLLDTNIIIYYLNGKYRSIVENFKHTPKSMIYIPGIVMAELEYGAKNSKNYESSIKKIYAFTDTFEKVSFDEDAAKCYGTLRSTLKKQGQLIGANDMLIAATALAEDFVLVTNNVREFERVEGIKLENWVDET